jgi:signal peptide peptidase SppA
MKTYPQLTRKLFCSPLMLHAPTRAAFESVLTGRMFGKTSDDALPVAIINEKPVSARTQSIYRTFNNVAVITIDGVIDKRISDFDAECYGGVDLADVDAALYLADNDDAIDTVVLDIHSPGGSVVGVADTHARIKAMSETKEIHAFVNAMCCSAGYYLASAADVISASPSAIVGSIGVYCGILDASEHYAALGLKMQFIQGGEFKTTGSEFKPLNDEEKAMLQAGVDSTYNAFKAACSERRAIADSSMQGQWFTGAEANTLGLVDKLTGATLDEYVSSILLSR